MYTQYTYTHLLLLCKYTYCVYTDSMRANIYIHVENEKQWESITNKSEWVNAYLQKSPPNSVVIKKKLEPLPGTATAVEGLLAIPGVQRASELPPVKVCKIHGTPLDDRGRCMQKGCKYA